MCLVCSHLVDDGLKARKHGIDGLAIKLSEVLVLPLLRLVESGFDLCGPLVIALKPHPDLPSGSIIGDSLELLKRKTREKNCASSAISVVLIFLILRDTSTGFKHNVSSILTNLPNKPINPLEMRGHANLPIGIICSIEERWFAGTTLHVAFVDHRPIKVE
jgi:hypothetical protein